MTDTAGDYTGAVQGAIEHIRRVCEWCLAIQDDSRITAILEASKKRLYAEVITEWGIKIRSGAGFEYDRVGGLVKGSVVEVFSRSGEWGKIGVNQWITLNDLYIYLHTV